MYSFVMMTVMTASPSGPEFNGYFRDMFRGGCYGDNRSAGCYGSSCHGFGSRIRAFFSFGGGCCGGCYGSCYGRSQGCYSTGLSCTGAAAYASCSGGGYAPSYSCSGGGFAPSYSCSGGGFAPSYSCSGGYAAGGLTDGMLSVPMGYAVPSAAEPAYYGGTVGGCYGGSSFSGPVDYGYPTQGYPSSGLPLQGIPLQGGLPTYPSDLPPSGGIVPQAMPASPFSTPTPTEPDGFGVRSSPKNQLPPPAAPTTNRATVVVKLPPDAKLYAENVPLQLTSAERTFVTPDLPAGREYTYTFKIEYDRNGRTLSEVQKVSVSGGRKSTVVFEDLMANAAPKPDTAVTPRQADPAVEKPTAARSEATTQRNERTQPLVPPSGPMPARITVRGATGAMLYVDGKPVERLVGDKQFDTPPLPPGREFVYTVAIQSGGPRAEQVSQKVPFRAGELVLVDFSDSREQKAAK